jgi:hypothetical protein
MKQICDYEKVINWGKALSQIKMVAKKTPWERAQMLMLVKIVIF